MLQGIWSQDIDDLYHPSPKTRKCGPTHYACRDSGENFAESSLIYELNWLAKYGGDWQSSEAEWILNGYTDAAGIGPVITDMSKWNDDGVREDRLKFLFGQ